MGQTDGEDFTPRVAPEWNADHALAALNIQRIASDDIDGKKLKNLHAVKAEALALRCCEALDLEGADYCRGYLQGWLYREKDIGFDANAIPEKSARKTRAADSILRAGRLDVDDENRGH